MKFSKWKFLTALRCADRKPGAVEDQTPPFPSPRPSPQGRGSQFVRVERIEASIFSPRLHAILPLLWGEGRGEGEGGVQSSSTRLVVSIFSTFATFLLALLLVPCTLRAQHIHLNAGALATTNGAPLYFINADSFIASSGYVFNSVLRTNGPVSGYYDAGVTFTAVGSDGFDGPPAAPGAQLALVVKSVTGPAGSEWAFWESLQCDDFGDSITFSLPAGTTNGMNQFLLSQNSGQPGEDPYGHCHGRRFTMTKPGLHKVAVQIVDVSHNGPGSGPIHAPSPLYEFNFQAGLTILRLEKTNGQFAASFPSRLGSRFYLETNSLLDGSLPWGTAAGPLSGDNRIKLIIDPSAPGDSQRFFRLRQTTP